jgi:hypothetical protein
MSEQNLLKEKIKKDFIKFIQTKTDKLTLPLYITNCLDAAIFNPQLPETLNQKKIFDCIFQKWRERFEELAALHYGHDDVVLQLYGVDYKIPDSDILKYRALFRGLKKICEFEEF